MEIETYPINRLRRGFLLFGMLVFPGVCLAGFTASDNFDDDLDVGGDILAGGVGWAAGWDVSGTSINNTGNIDGTALGVVYNFDTGEQHARRSIDSSQEFLTGERLEASWSFRSDFNVTAGGSMSMNLSDQGGNSLITFEFVSSEPSGIVVNAGVSAFVAGSEVDPAGSGVAFAMGEIYDVTFTSVIGSGTYDYTVAARDPINGSAGSKGNAFGEGRAPEAFRSFDFTMTGGGFGDGHLDNVSVSLSAVPEPTTVIPLGALLLPWFLRRRR